METIVEEMDVKVKELERALAYWEEVLKKSEKYERLMQDSDFQEVLKDLDQTVSAHQTQIDQCLEGMSEYSPKLLEDAQHTLFIHQLLKEQAKLAIDRPGKILELAKEARKQIPEIQSKMRGIKEDIGG